MTLGFLCELPGRGVSLCSAWPGAQCVILSYKRADDGVEGDGFVLIACRLAAYYCCALLLKIARDGREGVYLGTICCHNQRVFESIAWPTY